MPQRAFGLPGLRVLTVTDNHVVNGKHTNFRQLNSAVARPALAATVSARAGKHSRASGLLRVDETTIVTEAAVAMRKAPAGGRAIQRIVRIHLLALS
eukprot:6686023-Heterocapsa_arctica.AAC.1